MVIPAIDQSDPNRIAGEFERRVEAAESSANNHDLRYWFAVHSFSSEIRGAYNIRTELASHFNRFLSWLPSRKV